MTHIIKHSTMLQTWQYNIYDGISKTLIVIRILPEIGDPFSGTWRYKGVVLSDYIEDLYVPTQTELLLLQLEHDIVFVNDIEPC